jgi:hypothetical protein
MATILKGISSRSRTETSHRTELADESSVVK